MTTSTSATVTPVLMKSLLYGSVLAIAIAIVGSVVGFVVAGVPGLVSALLGAAMAAVFMGFTAASLMVANRVAPDGTHVGRFFTIVAGAGLLKFAAFTVAILLLGGQPWLNPYLFFWALVASVIGSLVADALAFQRARIPYVGDIALPGNPDAVHPQERR